jgi:hypothetical protein
MLPATRSRLTFCKQMERRREERGSQADVFKRFFRRFSGIFMRFQAFSGASEVFSDAFSRCFQVFFRHFRCFQVFSSVFRNYWRDDASEEECIKNASKRLKATQNSSKHLKTTQNISKHLNRLSRTMVRTMELKQNEAIKVK